jgi:hypothetical protein
MNVGHMQQSLKRHLYMSVNVRTMIHLTGASNTAQFGPNAVPYFVFERSSACFWECSPLCRTRFLSSISAAAVK